MGSYRCSILCEGYVIDYVNRGPLGSPSYRHIPNNGDIDPPPGHEPEPPHLAVELLRRRASKSAVRVARRVVSDIPDDFLVDQVPLADTIFDYVERYAELCSRDSRSFQVDRLAFRLLVKRELLREVRRRVEGLNGVVDYINLGDGNNN